MAADRRRREELLNEKRREDAAGGRPGQETPQVVCFGMIIPAVVLVVDEFPPHNTGALVRQAQEFISDDAAIVATILRQWDVRAGLIGTALGDDERGRSAARRLQEMGVLGEVRLLPGMTTPYEVDVSDRSGARTYFWQREPEVLATLDSADLSLLKGSGMLYVDWYDGEPILRAMREARRLGVPAFLNLEHGHQDADALRRFASGATICQVVTDPAQRGGDARGVAEKLLGVGVDSVLVTLAGEGCLAVQGEEWVRVWAPPVEVVDGCGAGAAFSAGFMLGRLRGWDLERSARFACAAASMKCTRLGPKVHPEEEIIQVAGMLRVERWGR